MLYRYIAFFFGLGVTFFLLSGFQKPRFTKDGIGISQFLMSLGYNLANATGIAGNLYVESKFDPKAIGDNGTSFGLAQWHKSRWLKLNEWSNQRSLNPNLIETQLRYLDWELKNKEKKAYKKLLEAKTPEESAFVFAKYYERPKVISDDRKNKAREIYNKIKFGILYK